MIGCQYKPGPGQINKDDRLHAATLLLLYVPLSWQPQDSAGLTLNSRVGNLKPFWGITICKNTPAD